MEGTASSDVALRYFCPSVLAVPYRSLQPGLCDSVALTDRRITFCETVVRFLTSVLAAEAAGLGEELPGPFHQLWQKLENPGLGEWFGAADALSVLLLANGRPLVAGAAARVLRAPGPRRVPDTTECWTALRRVIELRNKRYHPDGRLLHADPAADEEIVRLLRRIVRALQPLAALPLLYVRSSHEAFDGSHQTTVLRFAGMETQPIEIAGGPPAIPPKHVFVMNGDGAVLSLTPFIVAAPFAGEISPRIVVRREQGLLSYSDPYGGEPLPVPNELRAELVRPLESLLGNAALFRRTRSFASQDVEALLSSHRRRERAPTIPGIEIVAEIGRGAASAVYLARDSRSGSPPRTCALKVLRETFSNDSVQRQRFRAEYEILSTLEHPAFVRVFDHIDGPTGTFILMEWVDGLDLERIVERSPLTPDIAASVAIEILGALAAAHNRSVIHRDIKPANILLDENGRVRIVDFGIALLEGHERFTRTYDAVGTPAFAAPEQTKGAEVTPRTDIYAVGRLIEFLVTGSVRTGAGNMPESLRAVVRRATAPSPDQRYSSALEMKAALEDRRDLGWQGAVLEPGDRLNTSYELVKLVGQLEPGIWGYAARELVVDESVDLIVAHHATSRRLEQVVRALTPAVRRQHGLRTMQRTADGFLFAVFESAVLTKTWASIVDAVSPAFDVKNPTERPPLGPARHLELPENAPEYLAALRGAELRTVAEIETVAHALGMIIAVLARLRVEHEMRMDEWAHSWRCRLHALVDLLDTPDLWGRLRESDTLAAVVSAASEAATRIHTAAMRAAHGLSDAPATDADLEALQRLLDLAILFGSDIDPNRLWPHVTHLPSGAWAILTLDSSGVGLCAIGALGDDTQPVPSQVRDFVARRWTDTTDPDLIERRETIRRGYVQNAHAWLVQRFGATRVRVDHQAEHGEHPVRADLVVVSTDGARVDVAVDVRVKLLRHDLSVEEVERLRFLADQLETSIVAITDGRRWVWLRFLAEDQCQELDGVLEALEVLGATTLDTHAARRETDRWSRRLREIERTTMHDRRRALFEIRDAADVLCRRAQNELTRTWHFSASLPELVDGLRAAHALPAKVEIAIQTIVQRTRLAELERAEAFEPPTTGYVLKCRQALEIVQRWYVEEILHRRAAAPSSDASGLVSLAGLLPGRSDTDRTIPRASSPGLIPAPEPVAGPSDVRADAGRMLKEAERAISAGDQDRGALLLEETAELLWRYELRDEFAKVAERLLVVAPGRSDVEQRLVRAYLAKGDRERALRTVQVLYHTNQRDVGTLELLAEVFVASGVPVKAATVWETIAQLHEELGRDDLAERAWARVLRLRGGASGEAG